MPAVTCPNPGCAKSFLAAAAVTATCPACRTVVPGQHRETDTLPLPGVPQPVGSETLPLGLPANAPAASRPVTIGRFELRAKIGEGAFGAVYRAYDPQLDREVALKVAKPEAVGTVARRERFLREAKAAANLRHPNIVPVFDSGRDGERFYIASGFIEGQTLREVIDSAADQPLDFNRAVGFVRRLAEALGYAHRRGVLHRDVKPENVLIEPAGEPLLVDFGLAARTGEDSSATPASGERLKTQDGLVLGTPAYMSPEHAAGRSVEAGAAADQYALGVMLFEMITGRRPFEGPVEVVLFHHVETAPPPPRELNRAVSRDLQAIILRCLQKEPKRRYASCEELGEDLRRWQVGEPVAARPPRSIERATKWARRNPALATLFAVLFAGSVGSAAAAVAFKNLADDETTARKAEERARNNEEKAKLDAIGAGAREAVAKIGERTERTKAEDRLVRGYLREASRYQNAGSPLTGLPFVAEAYRLAVASDPTAADSHQLRLGAILAQSPRRTHMLPHTHPAEVHCSPDGRWLVTVENYRSGREPSPEQEVGDVSIWDATTGERRAGPVRLEDTIAHVAFSPRCDRLVVGTGVSTGRQGAGEAVVLTLPEGKPVCPPLRHPGERTKNPGRTDWVRRNVGLVTAVAFTPDGRRVVTCSDERTARVWDAATGAQIGQPLHHADGIRMGLLTADGTTLVTADDRSEVRVWDLATGRLRFEPPKQPNANVPLIRGNVIALHPHGDRLATADYGSGVVVWDLTTATALTKITGIGSGTISRLEFAPDGSSLLVAEQRRGCTLWEVGRDSPRLIHSLLHDGLTTASYSADGLTVVTRGSGTRFWDVKDGSECFPQLPDSGTVLHPDGHRAFTSRDNAIWAWQLPVVVPYTVTSPLGRDAGSADAVLSPDARAALFTFIDTNQKSPVGYHELIDTATGRPICPGWKHAAVRDTEAAYDPLGGLVVAFQPDGGLVATAGVDGKVEFRATRPDRPAPAALAHPGRVRKMSFRPGSGQLATAADDGTVRLWDVPSGRAVGEPLNCPRPVHRLAFSPDGELLLAVGGATKAELRVWDATSGKAVIDPVEHPGESLGGWVWPAPGRLIAVGKTGIGIAKYRLYTWDLATGKPVGEPLDQSEPEFDADGGRMLVSGRVYDTRTMKPDERIAGSIRAWHPASGVAAVNVTLGQNEAGFRVSRLDGQPLTPGTPLPAWGPVLVFSPDARVVATMIRREYPQVGSELRMWDARTGEPLGFPRSVPVNTRPPRFTPDGRAIIILPESIHMGAWVLRVPVEPYGGSPQQARGLARLLAGAALDDTGSAVSLNVRDEWTAQDAPPEPGPSADQLRAWHASSAAKCEWGNATAAVYHLTRVAALGADGPALRANLGRAYLRLRKWADARDAFTRAQELGGAHWSLRAGRGEAYIGQKDWKRAREDFDAAIAAGAERGDLLLARAAALAEAGDAKGARSDIAKTLRSSNDLVRRVTPSVREHFAAGNWRAVAAYLDYVETIYRQRAYIGFRVAGSLSEPEVFALRGVARFALGDIGDAEDDFEEAGRLWKDDGAGYRLAEQTADARLRAAPTDARLLHLRGFARFKLERYELALADLAAAAKADPKGAEVWVTLGDLYDERGDRTKAAESYGQAIARAAGPHPVAHLRRGHALAEGGDLKSAEADFVRTTELSPDWGNGWRALASVRLVRDDHAGFLMVLSQMHKVGQTHADVLRMWAWFAAVGDDKADPKDVLAAATKVSGKTPAGFDRVVLAAAQYRSGRHATALAGLAAIPDAEIKNDPEACLVRALCAKAGGDARAAEKWADTARVALADTPDWATKATCRCLRARFDRPDSNDSLPDKSPEPAPPPRPVKP